MVKKSAGKKSGKPNAKEKPGQSGSKDKTKSGDGTSKSKTKSTPSDVKSKPAQNDVKQKSVQSNIQPKAIQIDSVEKVPPIESESTAIPIDTQPKPVLSEEKSIPESDFNEKSAPNDVDQVVAAEDAKKTPNELKSTPATEPDPVPVAIEPTYCNIKHPLNQKWTLWYYLPEKDKDWERCQHKIHSIEYVEDFWSLFDHIKQPSELTNGVDYSFFKNDIRPMWEDPQNVRGGRITVVNTSKSRTAAINEIWLDVLLFLIGENFDYTDEVCGVVLNVRNYGFKVAVWTAIHEEKKNKAIGKKLKSSLSSQPTQPLSFELHSETLRNSQAYGRASSKSFFTI